MIPETPSPAPERYRNEAGALIDPCGGLVPAGDAVPSALDALALASMDILKVREALAEVANIGDWLMCRKPAADASFIQLFPNADRLKTRDQVRASAENVMGWLGGEWKVVNHVSRAAKVRFSGAWHDSLVMLHNVDGFVINETPSLSASKEVPHA